MFGITHQPVVLRPVPVREVVLYVTPTPIVEPRDTTSVFTGTHATDPDVREGGALSGGGVKEKAGDKEGQVFQRREA